LGNPLHHKIQRAREHRHMADSGGLSLVDKEHLRRRRHSSEWRRWMLFVSLALSLLALLTMYPHVAHSPPPATLRAPSQVVAETSLMWPGAFEENKVYFDDANNQASSGKLIEDLPGADQKQRFPYESSIEKSAILELGVERGDEDNYHDKEEEEQKEDDYNESSERIEAEVIEEIEKDLEGKGAALIVLSHNRPGNLRATLRVLAKLPETKRGYFTIYISCDYKPMTQVFRGIAEEDEVEGIVEDIWEMPRGFSHSGATPFHQSGMYKITEHMRFAFEEGFGRLKHSHLIILEDDLLPANDFLSFFYHLIPILDRDPTIWCISAWNDNGFRNLVINENRLFRTDFFPGLGWMIQRSHWENVLRKIWPQYASGGWDHWIRVIEEHENMDCIAPEVPRTKHDSNSGTTVKDGGKLLSTFAFSNRPPSPDVNPFGDVSYLEKPRYRADLQAMVHNAQRVSLPQYVNLARRGFSSDSELPEAMLVIYRKEQYSNLAKQIGTWRDQPRGTFEGILIVGGVRGRPFLILAEAREASQYLEPGEGIPQDSNVQPIRAESGQDCNMACTGKGLSCDADQLIFLNKCSVMKKFLPCERGCAYMIGVDMPAYVTLDQNENAKQCLRSFSESVSCGGKHQSTQRLCPCRS